MFALLWYPFLWSYEQLSSFKRGSTWWTSETIPLKTMQQTSGCIWVTGAWVIWEVVSPKKPISAWMVIWENFCHWSELPAQPADGSIKECNPPWQAFTIYTSYLRPVRFLQVSCKFHRPKGHPSSSTGSPYYLTETIIQYPYSKLYHFVT